MPEMRTESGGVLDAIVASHQESDGPVVSDARKGLLDKVLMATLRADAMSRVDAVVDTREVDFTLDGSNGDGPLLGFTTTNEEVQDIIGDTHIPLTSHAHNQMAGAMGIHANYYRRMLEEAPDLLVYNVRHWLEATPKPKLWRTVGLRPIDQGTFPNLTAPDPMVRAVLSDRYKPLDNIPFLASVLEVATTEFNAKIKYGHVDSERLHIQFLTDVTREIPARQGEIVQQGLTVRNSEVGDGRILVEPWVWLLICLNGQRSTRHYAKTHLGRTINEGVMSDKTKALEAEAVWSHVRDWVRFSLDPARLEEQVEAMDLAAQNRVDKVKPVIAVANIVKNTDATKAESYTILERYLAGDDPTQFGLAQAVTRTAQEVGSFSRSAVLEGIGGRIMAEDTDTFSAQVKRPVSIKDRKRLLGVEGTDLD